MISKHIPVNPDGFTADLSSFDSNWGNIFEGGLYGYAFLVKNWILWIYRTKKILKIIDWLVLTWTDVSLRSFPFNDSESFLILKTRNFIIIPIFTFESNQIN